MVVNKVTLNKILTDEKIELIIVSDYDSDMLEQIDTGKYNILHYERVEPIVGISKVFKICN